MISKSDRIRIEEHNGKKIIISSCGGAREKELIDALETGADFIIQTRLSFLAEIHDTHMTTKATISLRRFAEVAKSHNIKVALLGMPTTQKVVLKAITYLYKLNVKSFETKEEAIAFLTEDHNND